MDTLLFNIFGYKTNKLINDAVIKIQYTYKNYRNYQIKKRIDIIRNLIPEKEENYDKLLLEETKYWNSLRNKIKKNESWELLDLQGYR